MNGMHSLVGPYITDALDDDERDSFELHLESCAECRGEVLDLQETLVELAAFHEVAPPVELKSSILNAIAATPMLQAENTDAAPPNSPAAEADPNVVSADFGRRRRPVTTWLAAAAAVLAVALGGVTVWQQSELQSVRAADAQRVELLAAPDLQVSQTNLDGADVTYLVSMSRGEALIATAGFPAPGPERSWQVWVIQDDVPRSGAIIDEGGQLQVSVDGVAGGEVIAITNEPRGGSPAPTGDIQAPFELQTT